MDEFVGIGRTSNGDRQRSSPAVDLLGEAVVTLLGATETLQVEIAGLCASSGPAGDQISDLRIRGTDDPTIRAAHNEEKCPRRRAVSRRKFRRQIEPRLPAVVDRDETGDLLRAPVQILVGQSVRRRVGLVDQDGDDDCGRGYIERRETQGELELKRANGE